MKFEIPKDKTKLLKYVSICLMILGDLFLLFICNVIFYYVVLLGFILGVMTALSEFFGSKKKDAVGTFIGFVILLIFSLAFFSMICGVTSALK